MRYLRAGSGPPLVLLHMVRRQLDHFQLVIPRITDAFTVYAVDLPGMGWSGSSRAPVTRSQPSGPPSCAWLSSWTSPT